jgi:FAD/FMN-containing dehydrogenase
MSPREGFANNNIVGYQVVLSNGTIVETTSADYPDLFFALHAGSTNFGVATRYDLKAFPFTEYWGGLRLFNMSQASALVNGTLSYMDKLQSDPSGLTTLTLGYNGTAGINIALQSFAYLAADGSNAAIFSDLLSLPFNPALNTLRGNIHQQSLYAEIDAAFGVGERTLFSTFTFKADPQFPLDFFAHAQNAFAPFANTSIFWAINFQPLGIPALNKAPSNLNPQGLTAKNGNLICESLRLLLGKTSITQLHPSG